MKRLRGGFQMKRLTKTVTYPHPREKVWIALTDSTALAEWLMPNNFEPVVGRTFQFRVDPMLSFTGIVDCTVLEVEPPHRLVYSWVSHTKGKVGHEPMTLVWTLEDHQDGTRLTLEQSGLEHLTLWWRFSMKMGWSRMLKTLLPKVLKNVDDQGAFHRGAITRRDFGVKSVPEEFLK